jgi:hypothetical protein
MTTVIVIVAVVVMLVAAFLHLRRTRSKVMGYHDIETPRVNEATHGGGGSDG